MGIESSLLWRRLQEAIKDDGRDRWERVENCLNSGFPDTIYWLSDGRQGLAELKCREEWPRRPDTTFTLGLTSEQINFLRGVADHKGRCFLVARVADEVLVVPGGLVGKHTQETWREIAHYVGPLSYDRLREVL